MTTIKKKHKVIKINKHLYIISDAEIQKGDWIYNETTNRIHQVIVAEKNAVYCKADFKFSKQYNNYHKIIATTDPSHKLPLIPQSFIKEYTENNNIDEILVEYDEYKDISVIPEYSEVIDYTLKVNSNNEITIHPIKDCYTREEV